MISFLKRTASNIASWFDRKRPIWFLLIGPVMLAFLLLNETGGEGFMPYLALAFWAPTATFVVYDLVISWRAERQQHLANKVRQMKAA